MDAFTGMRVFAEVVEAGNFSAAARRFGQAPSTISRQVDALEKQLGVRLVNRTTRKLSLTEAGRLYYERAEQILADIDQANLTVSQLDTRPRGTLRLTVPPTFGGLHIAPALPEFLEKYPEVRVDLTMTSNIVDLVEEGIDLAVRIAKLKDSTLVARMLAPNMRVLCASPTYLKRQGVPTSPQALVDHNCLTQHYRGGDGVYRLKGPDDGRARDYKVSGNLQTDSAEALYGAVLGGLGLAILPTWLVGPDIQRGALCCALTDYEVSPTAIHTKVYAVYPYNRQLSPKVRAFVDFLVARFQPRPPWAFDAPPVVSRPCIGPN